MTSTMIPQKELELKFEAEPSTLRLLRRFQPIKALKKLPKRTNEASVYFDTNRHKLHQKGLLLRVRRIGKQYVQTIKATGNSATVDRNEWETEISDTKPDLRVIDGTPLADLITKKLRRGLKPVFETHIRRTRYSLDNNKYAIDLTVDRGKIDSGDGSAPICELELELKRGDKGQLFEIARLLVHAAPTQVSLKSKAERGYEFIDGSKDLAVKANPVQLPIHGNARDSFRAIGFACLKQILDNMPALARADPEGVHQMRVGVRRFRAAMSLFKDLLHDDQTATVKSELKWLAGELTPAREFAVLTKRVAASLKKQRRKPRNGIPAFSRALENKHKAALVRAEDAVTSARFRTATFEAATWLELGRWLKPEDDLVQSRGEVPIDVFAAEQLQRRYRKVRRRGKELAQLGAKQRHKLRIQVKKLRYAAEFFSGLFADKKAVKRQKKFTSALKQLQDGLGDLNDIAVDERLIASISPRNTAFAAGLLTGREEARESEAMSAAIDGFTELVKAKPFWH